MRARSRSFQRVIALGVLGAGVAHAGSSDVEPAYRHQIALAFWQGAFKGNQQALNEEFQRNGFSGTGSFWSMSGLEIDVTLWRWRMSLGIAEDWLARTTVRNTSTGAEARVQPTLSYVDLGYYAYVSRELNVYPLAGVSFDGVNLTVDPNASPLVAQELHLYPKLSEVSIERSSFAVNLGLGIEHFLPFAEQRSAAAVPGIVFGVRFGYLVPFWHRDWVYTYGSFSRHVPGLPPVDLGGPYVLGSIGFAWAQEGRR